jgi:hypothetical protein
MLVVQVIISLGNSLVELRGLFRDGLLQGLDGDNI